jgi:hypothetical protein
MEAQLQNYQAALQQLNDCVLQAETGAQQANNRARAAEARAQQAETAAVNLASAPPAAVAPQTQTRRGVGVDIRSHGRPDSFE